MKYFNYFKTRNHIYMAMILSFAVWMPAAVILACPAVAYASAMDSGVSVQPLMIGETDFSISQDTGEETMDPYENCLMGTDIPSAPEFFGLGPRGGELAWNKEGEVWYNFLDPAEEGSSTEAVPSEKAEECVAKLNDYLTARGYGREAAFRNRENGGTDIIWYKDACQVKITLLPQGTFKFMAAMGPSYVYEPEMLLGKWEGHRQDSGENYIMTLDFREGGQVEYMTGWEQSEAAFLSVGTYTVDMGKLHLTFLHDQVTGQDVNWDSTYEFGISNGSLSMKYVSGNVLNIFQDVGDIFVYSKAASDSAGEDMQGAADSSDQAVRESTGDFVLTDEDKALLKQQLNIPETAAVDFQIGEEYYWDAAEASVIPVTVCENGVCVAGAHISKETKELMRSIMTYQP